MTTNDKYKGESEVIEKRSKIIKMACPYAIHSTLMSRYDVLIIVPQLYVTATKYLFIP